MPYAKARWVDQNGRSHEWRDDVASNDRNQIKSQIYAQTGAKDVILSGVSPSDPYLYEEKRRQHIEEERIRRKEQEDRLKSNSHSTSTYTNNDSYDCSNESSSGSMDPGAVVGLIAVLGAIWVFVTFMPWILMTGYGAGATWVSEKITGQTIEEYNEIKSPTNNQTQKALITFVFALIMGGVGFVQGTGWQKDLDKDQQSKPEQIRPVNNVK